MLAAGTRLVAGVTPGKGGQHVGGVPVFDTVPEAVAASGADVSVIFVPARAAKEALAQAAAGGIRLAVLITEGIPFRDMTEAVAELRLDEGPVGERPFVLDRPQLPRHRHPRRLQRRHHGRLDSSPPGRSVWSREAARSPTRSPCGLTRAGLGQSTCVGMGGDPVHGLGFLECLELFEADPQTEAVVLVGEIGGDDEERAAEFAATRMSKPVVAYIAGFTAPPGRRMGHAGAIISGSAGTAAAKAAALEAAGIPVARRPDETPRLVAAALAERR